MSKTQPMVTIDIVEQKYEQKQLPEFAEKNSMDYVINSTSSELRYQS